MNKPPILVAQRIGKTYRQGKTDVEVLHALDLTVREQESIAIVGASGSGKSTLLHLLGGLDTPTSGQVLLAGQALATLNDQAISQLRNKTLGFVYQFHHLLPEFTALENVAMPLLIGREPKKQAYERAATMVAQVGLAHRLHHTPGELSGGERQRIAIARAMVSEPACLLADEPTGNLDQATAHAIIELMLKVACRSALIVVTHDTTFAAQVQKTYHLTDGRFNEAHATKPPLN